MVVELIFEAPGASLELKLLATVCVNHDTVLEQRFMHQQV